MAARHELSGVLIISPQKSGEKLSAMLDRQIYDPVVAVQTAGEARRLMSSGELDSGDGFEIVLINSPLPDEQGIELALDIAEHTYTGVILFARSEVYDETRYRVEGAGVLTVSKPLTAEEFRTAVDLATATGRRIFAIRAENKKLRNKIDELRVVSRAKLLLITQKGMTEQDAHRFIEKGAMDGRLTRREFAEKVIEDRES